MGLEEFAVTLDELSSAIELFVSTACEPSGDHLVHKGCGGAIRRGFLNCFYLNGGDSLDPGFDGCGIGPKPVPYCERCFPPDGVNYSYAVRFPILRESVVRPTDYNFSWGNKELGSGSLLLE